ncbi:MAG: type I methionyl aminopeptidase [candidate division KSB1 bacterium]|nr:type I methionyl aminopeptidase [candidate division KSB1 bacterium]MDQ7063762.1 type I methionyl aminopeptidase [candidate division KSB1 bacterium]
MIHLRNEREIEAIRQSCAIVVETLRMVNEIIEEGMTTSDLDAEIETFIRKHNARPAFKGYQGFPASACISLNDEVVHGIPNRRRIKAGDLVKVDVGVEKDGYFGDAAMTYVIGAIDDEAQRLLRVTHEALMLGIDKTRYGNRLSDISHAIQQHVERAGFSVVRQLVGHGIGKKLHEDPQVPNYGKPGRGPRLRPGMVLAIEPMVNAGTYDVVTDDDGWTVRSADGSLSAHFEHTVVIRKDGPEILTEGLEQIYGEKRTHSR